MVPQGHFPEIFPAIPLAFSLDAFPEVARNKTGTFRLELLYMGIT
jgi:hypothetical protein